MADTAPVLRDYEVTGPGTATSTGTDYPARQRLTGQPVALQRIAPGLAALPGFLDRLAAAARAAAQVRHPNVVATYDVVAEPDGVYLVTEPPGGPPLRAVAPPGTALMPATALAAADDLLAAVEAAHARGVVHGAITPDALAVSLSGAVRLDHLAEEAAMASLGDPAGTPAPGYASPERLAGAPPDAAADLYGCAAVTLSLLTGAPPGSAPAPAGLPGVVAVLDRALASDPARRHGSATELRGALLAAAVTALGPSWRLGSDLAARAAAAAGVAGPPATAATSPPPPPPMGPLAGFRVPPPPGSAVAGGALPPPPVAQAPLSPPPSYLPPPPIRPPGAAAETAPARRRVPVWAWIVAAVLLLGAAAAVAVILVTRGGSSSGGPLTVGSVALDVAKHSGANCDVTYEFHARGSLTGGGRLVYHFERSDGQRTPDTPVTITNESNFDFTFTWRFVGTQSGQASVSFVVTEPTSRRATQSFSTACG